MTQMAHAEGNHRLQPILENLGILLSLALRSDGILGRGVNPGNGLRCLWIVTFSIMIITREIYLLTVRERNDPYTSRIRCCSDLNALHTQELVPFVKDGLLATLNIKAGKLLCEF